VKKDPKARLRDIGDARVQIEEMISGAPDEISGTVRAGAAQLPWWRAAVIGIVAAVVSAGAGAGLIWRYKPASPGPVARVSIPLPEGQRFQITIGRQSLAMSRDGTALVYLANRRIYLRALADTVATPVSAASPLQLSSPAFSPDGRSVVFYAGTDAGGTLKKVATSGGAEIPLCITGSPFGISWGESGIVFGERRGVMRVSADGGEPEPLPAKDGEALWAAVLPDGRSASSRLRRPPEA
jgi:serine/threonine-protein kinase